jgi:hypothetical protein
MTISPLQIHKDYVTKNDFNAFKGDMNNFRLESGDFRDETKIRFNGVDRKLESLDKRMDILSRGFAEFREGSFRQMGILSEGFRDDARIVFDHLKTLEEKIDTNNKEMGEIVDQKLRVTKSDITEHFDKNHNELVEMINDLKR